MKKILIGLAVLVLLALVWVLQLLWASGAFKQLEPHFAGTLPRGRGSRRAGGHHDPSTAPVWPTSRPTIDARPPASPGAAPSTPTTSRTREPEARKPHTGYRRRLPATRDLPAR